MSCNIEFGEEHNIPFITQHIYVCNNRIATECIHVFCQDCYNTKVKNDGINNGNRQTQRKTHTIISFDIDFVCITFR